MAELRWILSGLGAVLIAAIWWWSARRSGQAPGNAELRESTSPAGARRRARAAGAERLTDRSAERRRRRARRERAYRRASRLSIAHRRFHERRIAPLEPMLSIRTGEFERVPILDLPMMAASASEPAGSSAAVDAAIASAEDAAPEPERGVHEPVAAEVRAHEA